MVLLAATIAGGWFVMRLLAPVHPVLGILGLAATILCGVFAIVRIAIARGRRIE